MLTRATDSYQLDQYKECPRGCEYPKGAIPKSCKDCSYGTFAVYFLLLDPALIRRVDCPKGKVKCNNKCQKPEKPCPSKTPKPPKTTSTDDYPSYPTEYPTYPDEYKRSLDAADHPTYSPADVVPELDDFLSSSGTIDSEESFADLLDFVATATFGVRDLPEPTLLRQYYRSTNEKTCEPGWVPCAVLNKGKADWECTDVQNALDSCRSLLHLTV